jgi:succinate dehydrogenase hydrophobic anchor subunit
MAMSPGGATHSKVARRAPLPGFAPALATENVSVKSRAFPIWLLLTAILLIPASLNIHLSGDGVKFTPGRAAIALLLLPGLLTLSRAPRRVVASDVFVFLTALWMIASRIPEDGLNPSAVASVIELFGGYMLGRIYFYGPHVLKRFLRIFKIIAFLVISIAVLDPIFGINVVQATANLIMTNPFYFPQYRLGIVRAVSTLEMYEQYGTFCVAAASIFLFMENKATRYRWAGFCFFGCVLALSSGPLLAFTLMISFFVYDRLLCRYAWRWKLVTAIFMLFLFTVFNVVAKPLSWIVSHLTLDPETGYFRIYVFDYVSQQIWLRPLTGFGFGPIGDDEFLSVTTVDNVWLVCAARYGIPMIAFFLLANLASFASFASRGRNRRIDPFMTKAATGFTQVILIFMLVGLTVHFWNAMWQFWAVCIGIRGSIKEWHAQQKT